MTGRVAMTDEDALAVHVVGCAMACGLKLRFVALQEEGASAVEHVTTFAVEIRTSYLF